MMRSTLSKITCVFLIATHCFLLALTASKNVLAFNNIRPDLTIFTEEFPPYNYMEDGKLTGINIKMVRAMCEHAGLTCHFEAWPWNRAFRAALNTPDSGLVSTARTYEREDLFKWLGPLSSGQSCVFKLASREDIEVPDMASLAQYSIGSASDSAYNKILNTLGFYEDKNLILYPRKFGDVKPFAAGRIDFIVASALSIENQLAHGDLDITDIEPVFMIDPVLLNGNFLAMNLNTNKEILAALQSAYTDLMSQNYLAAIESEYLRSVDASEDDRESAQLWERCVKQIR